VIAEATPLGWQEANEHWLEGEIEWLKARLRGVETAPRPATGGESALDELSEAFGLTEFERSALVLLAGVEVDGELCELCGGAPTLGALPALLPDAHWSALSPGRPLRRWHLVELGSGRLLTTRGVRIAERVLHHLLGVAAPEPALEPLLRECSPTALVADAHRELAAAIAAEWDSDTGWPAVQLVGNDAEGSESVAALVAALLGWELYAVRAEELPARPDERSLFAALWTRESILRSAALLVEGDAGRLAEELRAPLLIAAPESIALRRPSRMYTVARPSERERRVLWRHALDGEEQAVDALGRIPLGAEAIGRSAGAVRAALAAGQDPVAVLRPRGARRDALVTRITPAATWDDLVVPDQVLAMLRAIAAQVRHRTTVYEEWGFGAAGARGLGITALFTGESGTGKTMAAEVLADDLSLDLFVIDLSAVVSKYIGETEKNLARVFDAAEDGAILLFDEADALFGRRTEVRDSHDRYANLEVSYLLQRMEAYRGLAILTTNLKTALDRAFQRRLRFVVPFPFPDAALRERIWRGVFPAATPTSRLDWPRLAGLAVSGGTIRNIAVNAAFAAADAGRAVRTRDVLAAARAEYAKLERTPAGELRP
jgi:predicted nucleic acid-binding protein